LRRTWSPAVVGHLSSREGVQGGRRIGEGHGADGPRKCQSEKELLVLGPPLRETIAGHQGVVHDFDAGLYRRIPIDGVSQVHEHRGFFGSGEGVPVHPHPGRGREFRLDLLVLQEDGVIPWRCLLPLVGKAGAGLSVPSILEGFVHRDILPDRHDQ